MPLELGWLHVTIRSGCDRSPVTPSGRSSATFVVGRPSGSACVRRSAARAGAIDLVRMCAGGVDGHNVKRMCHPERVKTRPAVAVPISRMAGTTLSPLSDVVRRTTRPKSKPVPTTNTVSSTVRRLTSWRTSIASFGSYQCSLPGRAGTSSVC